MKLFKFSIVFSIILAILFSYDFSYAKLQDHFKKALGKSNNNHAMRNIDFIYMINLDRRPEKYTLSMKYLDKYGIKPYRFSAVDGWKLSLEEILDVGVRFKPGMTPLLGTTFVADPCNSNKLITSHEFMQEYDKTYFVHCIAPGALGCALSHISVLQDAYDSGYETVLVLEDDIEIVRNPHLLSDLIDELDSIVGHDNWDVLFTDHDYRIGVNTYLPAYGACKRPDMDNRPEERYSDKYTKTVTINQNFRTVAARFGTTSMIIRRSGIIKLLEFAKERNIYLPYDLENYLVPGIKRYGLNYDVITNMLNSLSDIGAQGNVTSEKITIESFLQKYSHQIYQDVLVKNQIIAPGTDHCALRYDLIKPILALYTNKNFSVLDLGAAQGYFSFSIAQEFPQSSCVMIESNNTSYYAHHGDMLYDLCFLNSHLQNISYLHKRVNLSDLSYLNEHEHFDVIIAFLVVHLMEETLQEQIKIIESLLTLGDNLIIEVANDVGVVHTSYVEFLSTKLDCQYLGEVKRHKDPKSTSTGKLFWFRTKNNNKKKRSSSGARPEGLYPDHGEEAQRAVSNQKGAPSSTTHPAITRKTFLQLNGVYPVNFQSKI